jgi:hypothetical protein
MSPSNPETDEEQAEGHEDRRREATCLRRCGIDHHWKQQGCSHPGEERDDAEDEACCHVSGAFGVRCSSGHHCSRARPCRSTARPTIAPARVGDKGVRWAENGACPLPSSSHPTIAVTRLDRCAHG